MSLGFLSLGRMLLRRLSMRAGYLQRRLRSIEAEVGDVRERATRCDVLRREPRLEMLARLCGRRPDEPNEELTTLPETVPL